jgi:hypothetical protein
MFEIRDRVDCFLDEPESLSNVASSLCFFLFFFNIHRGAESRTIVNEEENHPVGLFHAAAGMMCSLLLQSESCEESKHWLFHSSFKSFSSAARRLFPVSVDLRDRLAEWAGRIARAGVESPARVSSQRFFKF